MPAEPAPARPLPAALLLAALAALAVGLAVWRVPFRWTQIALAYMAYFHEYSDGLSHDGLRALPRFVGIHPPAYSLLATGLMRGGASVNAWFALSASFGVGAVLCVAAQGLRRSLLVGLASGATLALSPHRLAYALEPNNYPLLVFAVAAQGWLFARWVGSERRRDGAALLAATTLGLFTHALFVTVPVAQALALRGRARRRFLLLAGVAALLCLPLLPSVLAGAGSLMNSGSPRAACLWFLNATTRYGPPWAAAVVALLAGIGAARCWREPAGRAASLQLAVGGVLLWLLLARGTAASHQFPYALLFLPPIALLVGAALAPSPASSPASRWPAALLFLALLGQAHHARSSHDDAQAQWDAAAVTYPMSARAAGAWTAGRSLVLIGLPAGGDDDKDLVEPPFRFLPRDVPLRWATPDVPSLVAADPYWGQPVGFPDGRWLYSFTGLVEDHLSVLADTLRVRGETMLLLAYDLDRSPDEAAAIRAWVEARGGRPLAGPRELFVVLPPAQPAARPSTGAR